MMKHIYIISVMLTILSVQTIRADEVQWRVTRTKHFIIYYAAGHESTAKSAETIAENWHAILSRKLKFSPKGITPIYLYPDRRSFSEAADIKPGDMIVGLAHTRIFRVRVDASGAFADIASVIPHELVHVFVSRRLRGYSARLPLWMHEGLAKYLANDWSANDAELLADAAAKGEILPLNRISEVFPSDEAKRSIAYVQSYSAVKYMAKVYSPESITDLLAELEKGEIFRTALFYSIGVEPDKFEEQWRQYLWDEYGSYRWIRLLTATVSAAMAMIAVLAFRARVLRKRRKAAEFEEEDAG